MPDHSSNPVRTLMAFDFGLRQIGVATGNTVTGTEAPLTVLTAREGIPDWSEVESLLNEWNPDLILVGLPINMDGSDSAISQRARKFGNRVAGRFGVKVQMVDERLTSQSAKTDAQNLGHKGDYKSRPLDDHSAGLLIRQWLNQNSD